MRYFFDNIWRYIGDIFVDDVGKNINIENIEVRDLTYHYRQDFPNIALDAVLVGVEYDNIRDILESYKYHSDRSYAGLLVDILQKILNTQDTNQSIIVAVPMHWSRYAIRGFDHMQYILGQLSKKTKIPYIQPFRTSFSKKQSTLSRAQRLKNRIDNFIIKGSPVFPSTVYIIDDVISTGATAHECAKLLKAHGVDRVVGIFLASSAQLY